MDNYKNSGDMHAPVHKIIIIWNSFAMFLNVFALLYLFILASHHSAATNRGYSRKHDGGFYGC